MSANSRSATPISSLRCDGTMIRAELSGFSWKSTRLAVSRRIGRTNRKCSARYTSAAVRIAMISDTTSRLLENRYIAWRSGASSITTSMNCPPPGVGPMTRIA